MQMQMLMLMLSRVYVVWVAGILRNPLSTLIALSNFKSIKQGPHLSTITMSHFYYYLRQLERKWRNTAVNLWRVLWRTIGHQILSQPIFYV